MLSFPIYLDNNATTQPDPKVVEAMLPYFTTYYGNAASRQHSFGWAAEEAVEIAREQVANLIGAETQEIIFTSGATESINLALKGITEAYYRKGKHIITVKTEHKAVLDSCLHLEKQGAEITYLPVDESGKIELDTLKSAIRTDTILIAVMYANNETGIIQDIPNIGAIAHERKVLFFCDATQAIGKIPVNVQTDNIDLLALSAHKLYGSKGVGALYVRRKNPRVALVEQMNGGGHERAMRSGTLNIPGIVGLGKACQLASDNLDEEMFRIGTLRDKLEKGVTHTLPNVLINGDIANRLPNVSNLSFQYPDSNRLLASFQSELAVSAGSACTSSNNNPSYVLMAMGLGEERAKSAIRFGLGRFTTKEEIDFVIDFVKDTVKKLREEISSY